MRKDVFLFVYDWQLDPRFLVGIVRLLRAIYSPIWKSAPSSKKRKAVTKRGEKWDVRENKAATKSIKTDIEQGTNSHTEKQEKVTEI
ncbi:hypothetical protein TNIN_106611 [Trichonephila inaurata madagascariensis]|uniref:Uncharacterized protein n=1 Tax=Trichonephila inaurata madagascariensis TaxID=2747483 RepID=A0A8X6XBH5_9ARAC|nr:hypothetical protein TNIN_106611 [Trichonephila inaurata madagascariensis]